MEVKRRLKNLSKLSRELLAEGESERSDFKRRPEGISADDLVAFANSETGGDILAGVEEQIIKKTQVGIVCGCNVDDAAILQVLNKAVSCIPPVAITAYIENLSDKPILRVQVPSSETKPHCTAKGVYCRRDGTRNRPLHPAELLRLFLDSEASTFAARFETAAQRITDELYSLENSLESSIKSMADQLGWADMQLGDTESTLSSIEGLVANLTISSKKTNSRLRALFRQDKRDDPVRKSARLEYLDRLIQQISDNENLVKHVVAGRELKLENDISSDSDLANEDLDQLLKIASRHVRITERDKEYEIVVRPPKNCSSVELDGSTQKLEDGGEIASDLVKRAKRAFLLGFVSFEGAIVGTAALTKPPVSTRTKVLNLAKSKLDPNALDYELGWVLLDDNHRQKGQMTRLMKELLSQVKGSVVFAVSASTNQLVREVLTQFDFLQDGIEFGSRVETKKLFVRGAPETQSSN